MQMTGELDELRQWVESRTWYSTIQLAPGLATPGWFDHREFALRLPWPSLQGKRCLDIGTFEGFWAYEMERRGASEVIAVDELDADKYDWPARAGADVRADMVQRTRGGEAFTRVREVLGSSVHREHCNIYDLNPERFGKFDCVYVGSVLLHLRDPIGALEAVRSVCKPDTTVLAADAIDLETSLLFPKRQVATLEGMGRPWWWKPNVAGLARMYESAGFDLLDKPRRTFLKPGLGQPTSLPNRRALRTHLGREALVTHFWGDPHAVIVARPAVP